MPHSHPQGQPTPSCAPPAGSELAPAACHRLEFSWYIHHTSVFPLVRRKVSQDISTHWSILTNSFCAHLRCCINALLQILNRFFQVLDAAEDGLCLKGNVSIGDHQTKATKTHLCFPLQGGATWTLLPAINQPLALNRGHPIPLVPLFAGADMARKRLGFTKVYDEVLSETTMRFKEDILAPENKLAKSDGETLAELSKWRPNIPPNPHLSHFSKLGIL